METLLKDLMALKWLICVFFLKDIVFGYFMWALYRRTKITYYKISKDKGEIIRDKFRKANLERGKK